MAIIGLGYVGLPLAVALAQKKNCFLTKKKINRNIIGYDMNSQRVEELNNGYDRNKIFNNSVLNNLSSFKITDNKKFLKGIDIFLIIHLFAYWITSLFAS